jgi:hypothetical protein
MRLLIGPGAALAACLMGGTVPASALEMSYAITQMYASVEAPPPTADRITICYGFVCRLRTHLDLTPGDRKALADLLNKGKATPEAERQALRLAVQWLDRRMGPILNTTRRVARADIRHRDDARNYDCYDTTRNAVSLLLVLREWDLLRHHTISDPRYRGTLIFGQTPHNTAVLKDRASGQEWVLDLWPKAYGELPDVMPIERWMTEN